MKPPELVLSEYYTHCQAEITLRLDLVDACTQVYRDYMKLAATSTDAELRSTSAMTLTHDKFQRVLTHDDTRCLVVAKMEYDGVPMAYYIDSIDGSTTAELLRVMLDTYNSMKTELTTIADPAADRGKKENDNAQHES